MTISKYIITAYLNGKKTELIGDGRDRIEALRNSLKLVEIKKIVILGVVECMEHQHV